MWKIIIKRKEIKKERSEYLCIIKFLNYLIINADFITIDLFYKKKT